MKKIAALFLTVLIILIALAPGASAVVVSLEDGLTFNPGNTRWNNPEYNYAWIDQLFIRDDATSVTLKTVVPKPDDYPYSLTYEGFIEECDRYIDLYGLNEETVGNVYSSFVEVIYYMVVAMGFTGDYATMCDTLAGNGIDIPEEPDAEDKMAIAVVYAMIEYDAVYILFNEDLELPYGISLDEALVAILAKVTATELPSGVDTLSGLGVQAVKQYLGDYDEIVPVSDNPSDDELFYWLKATIASQSDYEIPLEKYDELTNDDKEYIDYIYFATILEMAYEVKVNPELLLYANESTDEQAIHRLVLKTMLDEKGVIYSENDTTEKFFELACINGYFPLENEFFSDVLKYEFEVAPSCKEVWMTPITLGDQLNGGDETALTVFLQNTVVKPGSTTAVALDETKSEETISLEIVYNDGNRQDSAIYEFRVIKNPALEKTTQPGQTTGIIDQVEEFVDSVVPVENDVVSDVFETIYSAIENISPDIQSGVEDILSTYPTDAGVASTESTTGDIFDFGYLAELVDDVYETDANGNIVTTKVYTTSQQVEEETTESFVQIVTQTVAENPEYVAAPTGLIALGSLLGFMMNKKRHNTQLFDDEQEETQENKEDEE